MPSSVGQQLVKLPFSSSSTFTAYDKNIIVEIVMAVVVVAVVVVVVVTMITSEGRVSGVEVVVGVVGVVHGRLPTWRERISN